MKRSILSAMRVPLFLDKRKSGYLLHLLSLKRQTLHADLC